MFSSKKNSIASGVLISASVSTMLLGIASPSHAFLDWRYTSDPHNDSHSLDGGDHYEIYGTAFSQDNDFLYFGIDSNLAITGKDIPTGSLGGFSVPSRNIGWGDLFLDPVYPGGTFEGGVNNGRAHGIRFSPNNGSGVAEQGVYHNVLGKNVSTENAGFWNLGSHNEEVDGRSMLGGRSITDPYYISATVPGTYTSNVISSGTYQGGITTLEMSDLTELGLTGFLGRESFGFKVSKSLLPVGTYIATLLLECLNDNTSFDITITPPNIPPEEPPTPKPVPEPGAKASILVAALMFGASAIRRKFLAQVT